LLCHDIGYVKGICREDDVTNLIFVTGVEEPRTITLSPECTDASLVKYHVDRGKLFVRERFSSIEHIDVEMMCKNIELTRFPVPNSEDHKDTVGFPGLVRAADLIGQLSDPRYTLKLPALYYEFYETGQSKLNGWNNPGDLRKTYPGFFWKIVYKFIKTAIKFLKVTQTGKQYYSSMLAQVAEVQYEQTKTSEV